MFKRMTQYNRVYYYTYKKNQWNYWKLTSHNWSNIFNDCTKCLFFFLSLKIMSNVFSSIPNNPFGSFFNKTSTCRTRDGLSCSLNMLGTVTPWKVSNKRAWAVSAATCGLEFNTNNLPICLPQRGSMLGSWDNIDAWNFCCWLYSVSRLLTASNPAGVIKHAIYN